MTAADDQPTDLTDTLAEAILDRIVARSMITDDRDFWRPQAEWTAALVAPVLAQREATLRERIAAAIEADLIRLIGHREVSDWKDGKVDGLNDAARIAREGGPT